MSEKESSEEMLKESESESALPVLRLLRPEFRAQLTLASRKSTSQAHTSPTSACSPRTSDTADGAVERIIPIVLDLKDEETNSKISEERETVTASVEKDGHHYLQMVLQEAGRLETQAAKLEAEVSSAPEHMEGRLRAAVGQARLLASQKLAQFKGLCHKNINQDTSEDFPTTCEDLAGFWDMVSIQIASVQDEFNKLDLLRKAGWPEQDGSKESLSNGSGVARRARNVPATRAHPAPAPTSTISKARDEARKKMLAERRKEMMSRKNPNTNEDIVLV